MDYLPDEALMDARLPSRSSHVPPSRYGARLHALAYQALAELPDDHPLPAVALAAGGGVECVVTVRGAGSASPTPSEVASPAAPPADAVLVRLLAHSLDAVERAAVEVLLETGRRIAMPALRELIEARLGRKVSEGPLKFSLSRLTGVRLLESHTRNGYRPTEAGRLLAEILTRENVSTPTRPAVRTGPKPRENDREAKERQQASGGDRKSGKGKSVVANLPQPNRETGKARDKVADKVGVGGKSIDHATPRDTPDDCADDVLILLEGERRPMTPEQMAEAFARMEGTFRAWTVETIRVACRRLAKSGEAIDQGGAYALPPEKEGAPS